MSTKDKLKIKEQPAVELTEVEKAKQLIEQEEIRVSKLCYEEIQQVLQKHNRKQIVVGNFFDGALKTNIIVIPK